MRKNERNALIWAYQNDPHCEEILKMWENDCKSVNACEVLWWTTGIHIGFVSTMIILLTASVVSATIFAISIVISTLLASTVFAIVYPLMKTYESRAIQAQESLMRAGVFNIIEIEGDEF